MPILPRQDLQINYQLAGPDLGSGQTPLALIHGLGANLAFWYLGAMRHLGQDRPVLMYDMRGHGASSMPAKGYRLEDLAEDFRVLLDGLGIERAHVVGHSHGARVALAFAIANPDRAASLTLADTQIMSLQPPMRLNDWPHWQRWKAELGDQGVKDFPEDDAVMDFRLLAELGPRGSGPALPQAGFSETRGLGLTEAAEEAVLRGAGPLTRRLAAGSETRRINLRSRQMGSRSGKKWQTLLETTTAETELQDEAGIQPKALAEITAPTLLIYGEKSHCLPTSDRLLSLIPGARRIIVPGAGHFFPVVKPRLFGRALITFLGSIEAPETPDRRRLFARMMAARAARVQPKAG